MIYIFDSNSLIDLFRHYYPNRFPSLWTEFASLINAEKILNICKHFDISYLNLEGFMENEGWRF
ncbi:MAG: DUF4411 family protein [Bacteroidales bacterium]|nr:DUF4411 family protein [Bacteroidales bacterium]